MGYRVCIIGAGVSGLRCAAVLLEHGFEVTVIEARDRIGGRIAQSDAMGPLEVDIGANWVHSTGNNPIVELAKETGTPLHLWNESTIIVDTEGNLVEEMRGNDALRNVWDILEKAMEHSRANSQDIDFSESLYDYFVQSCKSMVEEGSLQSEDADLVLRMAEMWGAYIGTRIERQSLKYFYLEDCIGGDDLFIPSNYKKIISEIARPALANAEVRTNTVMTSVEVQDRSIDESTKSKVIVKVAGEEQQMFDFVVVTSPLGWLKQHKDCIKPLSNRIAQAIDRISTGNLEKVLIEFPSPFWESQQCTDDGTQRDSVSFVHWLSPKYTPEHNPERWRLECVSFNAFPEEYRRSILLFYTYGDCSKHITSMIHGKSDAERSGLLREFFEPYYSRLPNYEPTSCTPSRILATEWTRDEFAGHGCYSNFQTGMTNAADDVRAIRRGMPEQHIYFAGEHTAPFDGLGTVAGAYNSGQAVALRIVDSAKESAVEE